MSKPSFKTALGISTGDIVSTSYGTGPYEVWSISDPRQWADNGGCIVIWPAPVISLTLVRIDHEGTVRESDFHWINEIRREGDRWFAAGDEVFVRHGSGVLGQLTMFDAPAPDAGDRSAPYPFQPDVDYKRRAWHCDRGHDFDERMVEPPDQHGNYAGRYYPLCPVCGAWPRPVILVGPNHYSYPLTLGRGR